MGKIISISQAITLSKKLRDSNEIMVLTGGCFDLLHRGHIHLLENAKEKGDVLFVLLESDQNIKQIKGRTRPINTQKDRGYVLSHIDAVDYVIPLPELSGDNDYDKLIFDLKPAIIATTKGDPAKIHKVRQAKTINARVEEVTDFLENASTTRLAQMLQKEL